MSTVPTFFLRTCLLIEYKLAYWEDVLLWLIKKFVI